ncbi:outer membrane lipoprotein carrier protein LolA [Methanosarcina sp. Z-7115]|uniref:Outer membrane lipoprotein carrier protein LolA n=1 Tax=Methanosarcina baikalica TaxID=3073890 RepID=A0ABU2D311_9EURY|nr:outer membrane lipoprotein carrier protein LolA [Methanosarcina sp. Z-7115]MDR7666367.1 outer membrane lipoprotein carrier protein LolA [Methanosarcina sp. Z-7115]
MITTKKFRSIFVLTFIVVILYASGCTEKNLSAEEITSHILDKENSTQDFSHTMHTTSYIGEKTEEIEYKTMFKKPNMFKSISTKIGEQNQTVSVSDGKFLWIYIPDTNMVTKITLSKVPESTRNDYVNIIEEFLNDTNITLLGVENIDGRTTYLLETTPKETDGDNKLTYKTKIWVDQETWMPLKSEIYNGTGNLTMKLEIRDLKVNTGIPDSEFKFEVPKGAKILDVGETNPKQLL